MNRQEQQRTIDRAKRQIESYGGSASRPLVQYIEKIASAYEGNPDILQIIASKLGHLSNQAAEARTIVLREAKR